MKGQDELNIYGGEGVWVDPYIYRKTGFLNNSLLLSVFLE